MLQARSARAALLVAAAASAAASTARAETRGVPLGTGAAVTSRVDGPGDVDTYLLDATAGTQLSLAFRAKGELVPLVTLLRPDGTALAPGERERATARSVRWRSLTLPETGRYAVVVRGGAGTSGDYAFTLTPRPARRLSVRGLEVAAGADAQVAFGAHAGAEQRVAVRAVGGTVTVTDLVDGDGAPIARGAAEFLGSRQGTRADAALPPSPALQSRLLKLTAGAALVRVDVNVALDPPRVRRTRRIRPASEPRIAAVVPAEARPGERISILGSGFQDPAGAAAQFAVLFGNVPGIEITYVSASRIDVTVPPGVGAVSLLLYNADGQEGRAPSYFRFADDPVVVDPPTDPVDPTEPADDGPLVHWDFDATSGAALADVSGHGFDGTLLGATWWTGGALHFDGGDAQVQVPGDDAAPPTDLADVEYGTISVRFRFTEPSDGAGYGEIIPLLHYGASPASLAENPQWDMLGIYVGHGYANDPDRRQIYFTIGHAGHLALCFDSASISLEPDRWYDYAVVIGPDGHHGYLDGVEFERHYNGLTDASSRAFFDTVADRSTLRVGSGLFGFTGRFWSLTGDVADVRVYDRVLDADEVEELHAAE